MEYLPYSRQHISQVDIDAVVRALQDPMLTQGPAVETFEAEVARYCGVRFAVAVNSATSGLHIACLAAGLKPGEKSITSPISFVASANCAYYVGAKSDFVDVDGKTGLMDPQKLQFDETVRVVVPVHYAGQSCDMKQIAALVSEASKKFSKKIYVIEDAAHGLGAVYDGSKIGSCKYSDMAVLSFHPVKSITTGEGGRITTNDEQLYKKLIRLRSHGITKAPSEMSENPGPWYYEQVGLGYNFRITDLQCSLGLSQLRQLDAFIAHRSMIAKRYSQLLRDRKNIAVLHYEGYGTSAYHLYPVFIDFEKTGKTRKELMIHLRDQWKIHTQVHYIPIYRQPYHKAQNFCSPERFPECEWFYERCLSIPVFPGMKLESADFVIEKLVQFLEN